MSKILVLAADIETIPNMSAIQEVLAAGPDERFKAPSNYGPEAAAKHVAKSEEAWKNEVIGKAGLDPLRGRICSVALCDVRMDGPGAQSDFFAHEVVAGSMTLADIRPGVHPDDATDADERRLLEEFFERLRCADGIVTCNGTDFDVPFWNVRSVVLGIRPPRDFSARRYSQWPNFDVQRWFDRWSPEHRKGKGLANLCRALGVPCPGKDSGMDGSQVYQYACDGRWDEIAAYNRGDTIGTAGVFNKIRAAGLDDPLPSRRRIV